MDGWTDKTDGQGREIGQKGYTGKHVISPFAPVCDYYFIDHKDLEDLLCVVQGTVPTF